MNYCPLAGYGFRRKPSVYGYGNTVSGGSKDKILSNVLWINFCPEKHEKSG